MPYLCGQSTNNMTKFIFHRAALCLTLASLLWLVACQQTPDKASTSYTVVEGKTMGTYYKVTYADSLSRDFGRDIDDLLKAINLEISTYIDSSTISRFNQSTEQLDLEISLKEGSVSGKNLHFWACYWKGREAYQRSGGAFDPSVMPLVNYWGFGYTGHQPVTRVDSIKVDSLLQYIGMDKITLDKTAGAVLKKKIPGVQLDFSGLGQGYGVDAIAIWLESRGITDYLVDIGGEQRARGRSPKGSPWRIGISIPREGAAKEEIITAFTLENRSVNTSGNYRNYYDVAGVKYGHTINPKTGYPEINKLLSATIFAGDCLTADALATTCMVMGYEKAKAYIKQQPGVDAFFIFGQDDGSMGTYYTEGLQSYFK